MTLKLGNYRHFKGHRYQVIDVATHTETEEKYVVYRALYGDKDMWIRPLSMFNETIIRDGKSVQRFQYDEKPAPCLTDE